MFCDQAAEERIFKESEMRIISERNNKNSRTYFPLHHHHHWWSLHHIRHVDPELVPQRHRPGKIFTDTNIIQYLHTHQHAQKDTVLITFDRFSHFFSLTNDYVYCPPMLVNKRSDITAITLINPPDVFFCGPP